MAKYLSNIDLNKNELQNPVIHPLGTAPGTPVEGQIYYDSTAGDKHIYLYNGTAWVQLSEGTHTTDYVSNVILSGTNLTFTGVGNAFNGTVDLSSLDEIVNDSTITISAGSGLSGGGNFTLNQASNASITINVGAGDGIDLNQDDIAVLVDNVTIEINGNGEVAAKTATVVNGGTGLATGDQIYDFVIGQGYITGNQTITLSGDVTGTGTTSIATTISAGAVDFAMLNPADVITEAEGIENNDNDVTIPTSAAVKAYADSLIVGGLIYQGGFDGSTGYVAGTTDYLDSRGTQIAVNKGWTYTVTVAGTFYGENVEVGDVLIAEDDLTSGTGALTDWTTVQNNIDLASASQVGIGNVAAGTGISVSYSNGTATVTNTDTNSNNSFSDIISDSDTVNYPPTFPATRDVIVQLYDTITFETVYADVERTNTTQLTVTFATTPTNPIKVLVQKIG